MSLSSIPCHYNYHPFTIIIPFLLSSSPSHDHRPLITIISPFSLSSSPFHYHRPLLTIIVPLSLSSSPSHWHRSLFLSSSLCFDKRLHHNVNRRVLCNNSGHLPWVMKAYTAAAGAALPQVLPDSELHVPRSEASDIVITRIVVTDSSQNDGTSVGQ